MLLLVTTRICSNEQLSRKSQSFYKYIYMALYKQVTFILRIDSYDLYMSGFVSLVTTS